MKTLLMVALAILFVVSCNRNDNPVVLPSTVFTPSISPAGGIYSTAKQVNIICSTSGAEIRYTLDGSEPTEASQLFSALIQIDSTTTVKARAFKDNWKPSAIASTLYRFQVAAVFILPMGGDFMTPQSVQIFASTPETVIHYTTDGTEPSVESAIYTEPLIIDRNINLKAKGFISGWTECSTVSVNFSFQVEQPTFSIEPGTYYNPLSVSLSSPTPGAVVRYTTDGTEPTEASAQYTTEIHVTANTSISAKAFKQDWNPSSSTTANYCLKVPATTFTPLPASFYNTQNVTIISDTPGTTIRYTTNGNAPSTTSAVYNTPVPISVNTTLKAIAVKPGWVSSNITTGIYNFNIYAPKFSLPGGQYSGMQTVSISCQTPGVEIRYTIDSYTPSPSSALYTAPLQISANTILKAKAFKQGFFDSPMTSATYFFVNNVAEPVFNPPQGEYYEPTLVSISCQTTGAEIRYTMDNTNPTTLSPLYTNPFLLNSNTTIRARAFYSDWNPSPIISVTYNVNLSLDMINIPAGVFTMGDTHNVGFQDAIPTHMITLPAYKISNFEIPQQEWQAIMGYNPSTFTGNMHRPVDNVSMFACMVFCNKKSMIEGLTPVYSVNNSTNPDYWGPIPTEINANFNLWRDAICNWSANGYRLPTEAEWEYAARGGAVNPDYLYSGGNALDILGWYANNGTLQTHPVGQKQANALGIYDMSGNVREWCWDWYDANYYAVSPTNNPTGPSSWVNTVDYERVIRGGCFMDVETLCMACARGYLSAYQGQMYLGFRIVRIN
jgi:formylglycine-generating enzyme required for sulfatase activity